MRANSMLVAFLLFQLCFVLRLHEFSGLHRVTQRIIQKRQGAELQWFQYPILVQPERKHLLPSFLLQLLGALLRSTLSPEEMNQLNTLRRICFLLGQKVTLIYCSLKGEKQNGKILQYCLLVPVSQFREKYLSKILSYHKICGNIPF